MHREFTQCDDKATVWMNSYEESEGSSARTLSTIGQTTKSIVCSSTLAQTEQSYVNNCNITNPSHTISYLANAVPPKLSQNMLNNENNLHESFYDQIDSMQFSSDSDTSVLTLSKNENAKLIVKEDDKENVCVPMEITVMKPIINDEIDVRVPFGEKCIQEPLVNDISLDNDKTRHFSETLLSEMKITTNIQSIKCVNTSDNPSLEINFTDDSLDFTPPVGTNADGGYRSVSDMEKKKFFGKSNNQTIIGDESMDVTNIFGNSLKPTLLSSKRKSIYKETQLDITEMVPAKWEKFSIDETMDVTNCNAERLNLLKQNRKSIYKEETVDITEMVPAKWEQYPIDKNINSMDVTKCTTDNSNLLKPNRRTNYTEQKLDMTECAPTKLEPCPIDETINSMNFRNYSADNLNHLKPSKKSMYKEETVDMTEMVPAKWEHYSIDHNTNSLDGTTCATGNSNLLKPNRKTNYAEQPLDMTEIVPIKLEQLPIDERLNPMNFTNNSADNLNLLKPCKKSVYKEETVDFTKMVPSKWDHNTNSLYDTNCSSGNSNLLQRNRKTIYTEQQLDMTEMIPTKLEQCSIDEARNSNRSADKLNLLKPSKKSVFKEETVDMTEMVPTKWEQCPTNETISSTDTSVNSNLSTKKSINKKEKLDSNEIVPPKCKQLSMEETENSNAIIFKSTTNDDCQFSHINDDKNVETPSIVCIDLCDTQTFTELPIDLSKNVGNYTNLISENNFERYVKQTAFTSESKSSDDNELIDTQNKSKLPLHMFTTIFEETKNDSDIMSSSGSIVDLSSDVQQQCSPINSSPSTPSISIMSRLSTSTIMSTTALQKKRITKNDLQLNWNQCDKFYNMATIDNVVKYYERKMGKKMVAISEREKIDSLNDQNVMAPSLKFLLDNKWEEER